MEHRAQNGTHTTCYPQKYMRADLSALLGALLLGGGVGGDVRVGGMRVAAHFLLQPGPVRDLAHPLSPVS